MIQAFRLGGALMALVLVLVACGGPAASPGAESPAGESPAAQTEAPTDTEAPAETDAPAETEAPSETDAPAETEAPSETEEPGESPDGESPAVPDVPTGLSGELLIWHTYASGAGTEQDVYNSLIQQLLDANPDLSITTEVQNFFGAGNIFEKWNLEVQGGAGPDMFIAPNDSLGAQVRQGVLEPLDDLAGDRLGDFKDLAVEGCTVDGALYCVPESLKAVAMYYDSSQVSEPPQTTDELLAAVQGGTTAGFNQGAYHMFPFWGSFGGQLMDDSGRCTAAETGVGDAHAYFQELQSAGATFEPDYARFADAFNAGDFAIIVDGPWATGGYRESLGDNLAVAPVPSGPGGPATPLTGTDGWYVNPNSENKELALEVALFMSSPGAEQVWVDEAGHIPAVEGPTITDPITQGFAEAVETGYPRPQVAALDNFWGNFDNALNETLDAGADPQEAVQAACEAMDQANRDAGNIP